MTRALRIASTAVAIVVVVAIAVFFLFFGRIGAWVVRHRVLPKVERILGRQVEVAQVRVAYGRVILDGITVSGPRDAPEHPLATVGRVSVEFDWITALWGDVRLGEVTVDSPRVLLVRGADGRDNFADVLDRLGRRTDGAVAEDEARIPRRRRGPRRVVVTGGVAALDDRQAGFRLSAGQIDGSARWHGDARLTLAKVGARSDLGPEVLADRITVAADLADALGTASVSVEGGSAALWPRMQVTGIVGHIVPAAEAGRALVRFDGGYGGVEGRLWHAEGWLDPKRRDAELHVRADRFTLDKLAPILGAAVLEPEHTAIETRLDVAVRGGDVSFAGDLSVAGLSVYHPWLADRPLRDLGGRGSLKGRYTERTRLVQIDSLGLETRGVRLAVEGYAALPGGLDAETGARRARPRVGAHVVLPPVPCQQALDAIPPELAPRLRGFVVKGEMAEDVRIDIDWGNLDALVLEGLDSRLGMKGCKVVKAPPDVDARRLLGEFTHYVEVERDGWMSFRVGPSNSSYRPLWDVSPYLVRSLVNTEDGGFWSHHGFITRELRSALVKNLKAGYFRYGASSITMQLVKNVLLYREKTLSRKLQELFLTHYLETTLGKDRILEIYVNVIELGPGIYGVGPAAEHYFGKPARDLNPVEAAFFSTVLPNPKERYMQYCEGQLKRVWDNKVQRILKLLAEREELSPEEYELALATPLVFDRSHAGDVAECKRRTRKMMKNARPTTPPRRAAPLN